MLKHVIVERPRPEGAEAFVALALQLRAVMADRGWTHYTAWRGAAADEGEPALFDAGILKRADPLDAHVVVFEASFDDRGELEAQLAAMRNDGEVVRIILAARELIDPAQSRAWVIEDWWPSTG